MNVKKLCSAIIITIAIELVLLNIFAYYIEYNRSDYKVIMVQIEKDEESEFIIEYGGDHNTYQIFPIAYENEDYYIITRLYCENGRIGIDYDFQSIIRKDGQDIYKTYIILRTITAFKIQPSNNTVFNINAGKKKNF